MKTFEDLEFKKHPMGEDGLAARMTFPNGYGISVVRFKLTVLIPKGFSELTPLLNHSHGYGSYTDNEDEWECAVTHHDKLCYDTSLTDDVIGHCTKEMVTDLMKQIQELPE